MKRLFLGLLVLGLLTAVVACSGTVFDTKKGELQIEQGDKNPFSHLRLNNDPAEFQFAIISDRTGGHRPKIFSRAVEQLNLMQPEFVVSVGDLIEGYGEEKDRGRVEEEWREFQSYVNKLQMPFFYVPGNHDMSNPFMARMWQEKFGRAYYHFVYRNVLFLLLNADEHPDNKKKGTFISPAQIEHFRKVLAENKNVHWTIVAIHKPLWAYGDAESSNWPEFEKLLLDRPYTVFAGHVHRYQKFVRHGRNYYQLATTGGGSKVRGPRYGEFDHFVWVTMKKDGPILANIMLSGVLREDLSLPDSEEKGVARKRLACQPGQGKVLYQGKPVPDAQVVFYYINPKDKKLTHRADALCEADGTFVLSTYEPNDGIPMGEYAVAVSLREPAYGEDGKPGPNKLPAKYASPRTSGIKYTVKEGTNEFVIELQ
jgi:hypothetical protein